MPDIITCKIMLESDVINFFMNKMRGGKYHLSKTGIFRLVDSDEIMMASSSFKFMQPFSTSSWSDFADFSVVCVCGGGGGGGE